jgi:hypothetical protein
MWPALHEIDEIEKVEMKVGRQLKGRINKVVKR